MQFIDFRDHCVVERKTGKNAWDEEVRAELYSGKCLYVDGGITTGRAIIVQTPTVFLPQTDEPILINDHIEITTQRGREVKGTVAKVRDIELSMKSGEKITRIEIKQGQGE